MTQETRQRENADVETASADYATRFAGAVGQWFLAAQASGVLQLLKHLPPQASILDVGGGHAQVAPALIEAGHQVTVVGSHPSCRTRLAPWIEAGQCRFEVADLQALPYGERSFDVVVCFRLLPHSIDWTRLIGELCRVANDSVLLDYPSTRSINVFSDQLFRLKRRIERNTRAYALFSPRQVQEAFQQHHFRVSAERPQFLLPMVLHRWAGIVTLSRLLEAPGRLLGLTAWFGSPVIVRADRQRP
jgi:SAM-dependent methyltransferase